MTGVTFYCIATKGTRNIPAFWCQSAGLIGEIAAASLPLVYCFAEYHQGIQGEREKSQITHTVRNTDQIRLKLIVSVNEFYR